MAGSPLAFDFDFTNLIISGKSSGEYEAENDLYSDWKELFAANADGIAAGVPPAFIESKTGQRSNGGSVGGNPISATQSIAPYYFLNNTDGWRLRPPEEDGETTINGNLFPLDPNKEFIIPTTGNFTQLLRLVVSPQAIVDSSGGGGGLTAEESSQLQDIWDQVERAIYVDTGVGSPDGDGSQTAPFNTFAAAANLAESTNIRNIVILGDSTFDRALPKYNFIGRGDPIVDLNGQNVNQSTFRNMQLQGVQSGKIEADDCSLLNNMSGLSGIYRRCGLDGSLTLSTSSRVIMADAYSSIPGLSRPDIDMNGGNTRLALRRYAGGMTISGMTNANNEVTIESMGAKTTLDSSNTSGTFSIRGVGQFSDESAGTTVDESAFIQADDITFIKGLVGGDAIVSLDDLTVTIYNNDVSPRQVLAIYSISADERVRTRIA
jgi:hypothetical protein